MSIFMYQNKKNGGLGLLNVLYKAQSIMTSTFLKQLIESKKNNESSDILLFHKIKSPSKYKTVA